MANKVNLTNITDLQNENTVVSVINNNNASLTTAINNTLFRDGTSPNPMTATLDMNSNRIINLPTALSVTEPISLAQMNSILASHQVPNGLVTSGVPVSVAMQPVVNAATLASARSLMGISTTRTLLTGNTTFNVSKTGSDANDGITLPWLTIQHAVTVIQNQYDLNGFVATIQVGNGTYTESVTIAGTFVGQTSIANVVFRGDPVAPTNVIINGSAGFSVTNGGFITVRGFKFVTTGTCLGTTDGGSSIFFDHCDFGACSGSHIIASTYSRIRATGDYSVSGSAVNHMNASAGQCQIFNGVTVTIPNVSHYTYFFLSTEHGLIDAAGITYVGAPDGTTAQYGVTLNGVLFTGNLVTIPGNSGLNVVNSGGQAA